MKKTIEINDVISRIWDTTNKLEIANENSAVEVIREEIDYIRPKLKEIESGDGSIIIISAPGAVGKTTFAKYFSKVKKGYYWDLSKIKLGDNSFIGTVANVFGSGNLTSFLDSLDRGELSLFLDAFDEAEIRSGLDGLEKFVGEVYSYSKNSPRPNIVFFSRSETAEYLQLILMGLNDSKSISVYEIDYFDESGATQFIKKQLEVQGDSMPEIHPIPFNRAISLIFETIASGMNVRNDIWQDNNVRSFIGYAPVLQTIAGFLYKQNYESIADDFSNTNTIEGGIKVITKFISELLDRERKKLITPLKNELDQLDPSWSGWDELFNEDEQLKTVLFYIANKGKIEFYIPDSLPNWLIDHYKESIQNFISNHPFIRSKEYSSPAFRDYTLSKLLADQNLTKLCTTYIGSGGFALTQLFAFFYKICNSDKCKGEHIGFIYEAASSKKNLDDGTLFTFIEKKADETYTFEIANPEGDKSTNLLFECTLNDENPIIFERRLVNAVVEVDAKVIFGRPNSSIEISDTSVRAKTIDFHANECFVNCFNDSTILVAENATTPIPFSIKKSGTEEFSVFWDTSKVFPWTDYNNDSLNKKKIDVNYQEEIYALQRILSPFRKHRKKEFAKHCEFIENVIVGSSEIRKNVLNTLISTGIMTKENSTNQFILREDQLNKIGITWNNIKTLTHTDEMISLLSKKNPLQ